MRQYLASKDPDENARIRYLIVGVGNLIYGTSAGKPFWPGGSCVPSGQIQIAPV